MKRRNWETPKLLVLVRTIPEEGVLQVQLCKFANLAGPGGAGPVIGCVIPPPGGAIDCQGILAS